jgi:hypothetical protein
MEDYYFFKWYIKCLKDEILDQKNLDYEKKALIIIINHQNKYLLEFDVRLFTYYIGYDHLKECNDKQYLYRFCVRYCLLHINLSVSVSEQQQVICSCCCSLSLSL